MFMITYIENNKRNSKCVICRNAETAIQSISADVKIVGIEKLY